MLAKVYSAAIVGLESVPIEVEIDIASQGLPSFTIVGLPDKAVEESKERVRSAIKNSNGDFPPKRITVNLAPADIPKEGPSYDLAIAIGILLASGQLQADMSDALCIGELSLDGRVRHVNGILPHAIMAKERGFKRIFIPKDDTKEAAVLHGMEIFPLETLTTFFNHLTNASPITPAQHISLDEFLEDIEYPYDLRDIIGQEQAKRALEIAAAGAHNLLMKGPPGAGKTLLAKTLPSILPNLTFDESLEVTKMYSISGMLDNKALIVKRPFRNPHHTTSHVGLIGGSATPRPGEISLAHRGVLFLDEFPEFPRHVLEAMRQPIEDGVVSISRALARVQFPAKFMLVAAQNPCPCGYYGDPTHECKCASSQILRYTKKISGPLLDRIDIHIDVPAVKRELLHTLDTSKNEASKTVQERVQKARDIQTKRFVGKITKTNAEMTSREIKEFCIPTQEGIDLLHKASEKMNLSARSFNRLLKVARTLADLQDHPTIESYHIAEALQYRPKHIV